jgi:4-amino-4-deoxychorismate lyase
MASHSGKLFKNGSPATDFSGERAFVYADGVFETIRIANGAMPLWPYHSRRLALAEKKLKLQIDYDFLDTLLQSVLSSSNERSATLKLIVSRVAGSRGSYPISNSCNYYTQLFPARQRAQEYSCKLISVSEPLLSDSRLVGLKLINRLPYVVPTLGISIADSQEALFYSDEGRVIETMHHNIFVVKGLKIITPLLSQCGVEGVMRAYLLENGKRFGCEVSEEHLSKSDLYEADGVFLTNALDGIVPAESLDDVRLKQSDAVGVLKSRVEKALG